MRWPKIALGVEAIFTGTVIEAHTEQCIYAYWRPGVISTARVKFAAQVISTRSGREIIDETVSQTRKEDVTGAVEVAQKESLEEPLTSCAREAVEKFVHKIAPYYAVR